MVAFCIICFTIVAVGIIGITKSEEKREHKIMELSEEERKKYYDDNTIDYTIVIGNDSKKSLGSAVIRGTVGGALLGPVGLVGGAISGKNKSQTTFTIVYKSGRTEVKTVDNDSYEFQNLAKYVR